MRGASISKTGLVRTNNEDQVFCQTEDGLFMVADGMGGAVGGEVASAIAVDVLSQELLSKNSGVDDAAERLRAGFYQANDMIYTKGGSEPAYNGMGTTLTVLWLKNGKGYIAHVGDSRAYLFRAGQLHLLTEDHSVVGEMLREGKITLEQAKEHPQRHIITRALGAFVRVDVDIFQVTPQAGDGFLLCTDGLSNLVSPEELTYAMKDHGAPDVILQHMIGLALKRGGPDNISAVLVWLDEDPEVSA